MNIVEKLMQEFSFYKSDKSYYELILSKNKDKAYVRNIIISNMQKDLNNMDNTWFIKYIANLSLNEIGLFIHKYNFIITIPILKDIIDKDSNIEKSLDMFFKERKSITINELEKIVTDKNLLDIYITYGLLKGYILLEESMDYDKDSSIKEIYYSDNTTKNYLTIIRNLYNEHSDKKNLYIEQYFHYKDILLKTNDDKEKENTQKLVLKYRNLIVEAYMSMAVSIAKHYQHRGLELIDLCQIASEGIIKALEEFDITKGFQFSTYATYWIRNYVYKAVVNLGPVIRVTYKKVAIYNKVLNTSKELSQMYQRDVTPEEIAEELDIDINLVNSILQDIRKVSSINETPSWDSEDKQEISATISDDAALFEEDTIDKMYLEYLIKTLDNPRYELVIRMRYGIDNNTNACFKYPHTQEEVAKFLGVTRTRIYQIEQEALKKMLLASGEEKQDYSNKVNIRGKSKMVKSPIKNKFFKDIVLSMPEDIRDVTNLYLGIKDGIMYDLKSIASVLNMDESEVKLKMKQGIDLFISSVEKYRFSFIEKFPDINKEADLILKLIK